MLSALVCTASISRGTVQLSIFMWSLHVVPCRAAARVVRACYPDDSPTLPSHRAPLSGSVDGGQRAVIFDKFQGVLPDVKGEGTHFKIPFIQVCPSPLHSPSSLCVPLCSSFSASVSLNLWLLFFAPCLLWWLGAQDLRCQDAVQGDAGDYSIARSPGCQRHTPDSLPSEHPDAAAHLQGMPLARVRVVRVVRCVGSAPTLWCVTLSNVGVDPYVGGFSHLTH